MKKIWIKDKKFKPTISTPIIERAIREMAADLNKRYCHEEEPVVFMPVLNGAMVFATNIFTKLKFPVLLDTVKVSSYEGESKVKFKFDKEESIDVKGKKVILVEDIIDTGETIDYLKRYFKFKGAKEVFVVTLLLKFDVYSKTHSDITRWGLLTGEYKDKYLIGFDVDDKFVVGYGMDYNGLGRNLNKIYIADEQK